MSVLNISKPTSKKKNHKEFKYVCSYACQSQKLTNHERKYKKSSPGLSISKLWDLTKFFGSGALNKIKVLVLDFIL